MSAYETVHVYTMYEFARICVCISVSIWDSELRACVRACVCVYLSVCAPAHMCMHPHVHAYVYVHTRMCVSVCVCTSASMSKLCVNANGPYIWVLLWHCALCGMCEFNCQESRFGYKVLKNNWYKCIHVLMLPQEQNVQYFTTKTYHKVSSVVPTDLCELESGPAEQQYGPNKPEIQHISSYTKQQRVNRSHCSTNAHTANPLPPPPSEHKFHTWQPLYLTITDP